MPASVARSRRVAAAFDNLGCLAPTFPMVWQCVSLPRVARTARFGYQARRISFPMSPVSEPAQPMSSLLARSFAAGARNAVRSGMAAWGRHALSRLRRLGVDLACAVEDEHGMTRAIFLHGEGRGEIPARLIVESDSEAIAVAMEIPLAGLANLTERLGDPSRSLDFESALACLPEQFTIHVRGSEDAALISSLESGGLLELVERASVERRSIGIGWTLPRAVALAHVEMLDEQVENALVVLGVTAAGVAWTPDGAILAARDVVRGDDASGSGTMGDGARLLRRRFRAAQRGEIERELDGVREVPDEGEAAPMAGLRQGQSSAASRMPGGGIPIGRRSAPRSKIVSGARVCVLAGPFAGKIGVVQELDGKGGARVMLGLLGVRMAVGDLASSSARETRPRLSTSHRKPHPVRS